MKLNKIQKIVFIGVIIITIMILYYNSEYYNNKKNEKHFNRYGFYRIGTLPPLTYDVLEKYDDGTNKFVKEYRNNKLYSDVEYYDNGIEKVRKNYIIVDNGVKPIFKILIKNYKSGKNKLWVLRNNVSFDGETFMGDKWEERYENGKIKSWGFYRGTQKFFNKDGSIDENGVVPF